ncbi:hypothetical protein AOLI_G00092120 [Acnodon oligacanthus]
MKKPAPWAGLVKMDPRRDSDRAEQPRAAQLTGCRRLSAPVRSRCLPASQGRSDWSWTDVVCMLDLLEFSSMLLHFYPRTPGGGAHQISVD